MAADPPTTYRLAVTVRPVGTERVPVATEARVLTPVAYVSCPEVRAEEVESPFQEMAPVPPLYAIGNVPERAEREM